MLIPCPHCGARNEDEFVCWSEAEPRRPEDPGALDDAAWVDYVYNHTNPKGWSVERWYHARGCGRWVLVERNTLTHEVRHHGRGPVTSGDGSSNDGLRNGGLSNGGDSKEDGSGSRGLAAGDQPTGGDTAA